MRPNPPNPQHGGLNLYGILLSTLNPELLNPYGFPGLELIGKPLRTLQARIGLKAFSCCFSPDLVSKRQFLGISDTDHTIP